MNVLIIGAAGKTGAIIVERVIAGGHVVTAFVRAVGTYRAHASVRPGSRRQADRRAQADRCRPCSRCATCAALERARTSEHHGQGRSRCRHSRGRSGVELRAPRSRTSDSISRRCSRRAGSDCPQGSSCGESGESTDRGRPSATSRIRCRRDPRRDLRRSGDTDGPHVVVAVHRRSSERRMGRAWRHRRDRSDDARSSLTGDLLESSVHRLRLARNLHRAVTDQASASIASSL